MKNKCWIILLVLVIVAAIIVAIKGFNVGVKYSENDTISIQIGKEFEISDVKKITNEVFKNKSVIIQKVEMYKDIVQITVKSASGEQIEELRTKTNEKFEIENEIEDISVMHNANTKLSQIAKHYIIPIVISIVIIICYEIIRFRKQGALNVIKYNLLLVIISQIVLACIYAICRIPVNNYAICASLGLYLISEGYIAKNLLDKEESANKKK